MQDLFIEFLPPWVETGLQPAFYDQESGTVLQQTARMYAKVNELVKAVNGMDKVVKEYVNYIDNYFKNLDVQEEVNNKLEDMAEQGELETYIAQFLAVSPVFAFETISDMEDATNLVAGSIARVIGNTSASDGDGAYYIVRATEPDESADGVSKVAIGDTLIADRIADGNLASAVSDINDDIDELSDRIDNIENERVILIGDSYSVYRPETEGIEGWAVPLRRILGLSNSDCVILSSNGGGFITSGSLGTFQNALANASVSHKETITKIVVCAGINDFNNTTEQIKTAISNFVSYCKTNYPKAKVYLGMISWDDDEQYTIDNQYSRYKLLNIVLPAYQEAQEYGAIYLNGVENVMHDYSNYYDRTHPNETLCLKLANYIYNALNNGYASVSYPLHRIQLVNTNISDGNTRIYEQVINNQTVLYSNLESGVVVEYTSNYPTTLNNSFYFGNMDSKYLRCVNLNDPLCTCPAIITDTNNQTYEVTLTLYIKNWCYVHAHFASTEIEDGLSIKSVKLYDVHSCRPTMLN